VLRYGHSWALIDRGGKIVLDEKIKGGKQKDIIFEHFPKNKAALEDESNTECIYLTTSTCTLIPSMP
jgi:hypothetical protein